MAPHHEDCIHAPGHGGLCEVFVDGLETALVGDFSAFRFGRSTEPAAAYEIHPSSVCNCTDAGPTTTVYLNIPGLSGPRVVERAHIVEVS